MLDERYKDALCLVCRQSAILEQYYMLMKEGKEVDENTLIYHLELLVSAKESFLALKKELGYTDGLSFMDDANFCGFSYKNGCLSGNYSKLPDVLLPFVEKESDDTHFRYEVGILLFTHYFMQRGEYGDFRVEQLLTRLPLFTRIKIYFKKKVKEVFSLFYMKEDMCYD